MHEYGLAQDIASRAVREAERHRAARVAVIHVALGAQELIDAEALALGIRVASAGTLAGAAEVRVRRVPGRGVALESMELPEE